MLSDIDVDGRDVPFYEMEITTGKIVISVDPATSGKSAEVVRDILEQNGGRVAAQVIEN